jgi:hypothetical protein
VIDMKQMTRPALVTGFVAALLLMASNAFADEIVNFTLATTNNAPSDSFDASGTITIDTTTGVVDAIDLNTPGDAATVYSIGTSSGAVDPPTNNLIDISEQWCVGPSPACFGLYSAGIVLPVDSLIGYDGGPICSTEFPCFDGVTSGYGVGLGDGAYTSGELVVSPEPSSLLLALTGSLGIAVALIRKRGKSERSGRPQPI